MKTKIIIFILFLLTSGVSAQDIATSANGLKTNNQIKKEQKDAAKVLQYQLMGNFLDSMRFVLEADYLSNSQGMRSIVTASLNYILVDSMKGTIQTGSDFGFGRNGVGGATAKGTITSWKLTKNEKRKNFFVKIDFSTDLGFYTVFMDVSPDGRASARLTGIGRGSLTFDGKLKPLKKSRVFRGMSGY